MRSKWDTQSRYPAGKKAKYEKKSSAQDANAIYARAVKKASNDLRKELREKKVRWDNAEMDSDISSHEMDNNQFTRLNISNDEDSDFE